MTASSTAVAGTGRLLRASLRHEARSFVPYVLIVTALSVSSVVVYPLLFPDLAGRREFAATVGANPATGLIFGPAYDLSTVDGFNAWRSLALGGLVAALAAIFVVVRASRGQEDSGQAELLASGVLGRQARLLTALALGTVSSLAVGVIAGVVTALCGGGWGPSLLLGAGFTVTGLMFAALTGVTAQLGADAHAATTMAVGVLGILFVLRGFLFTIGAPSWTTWLNPLGWVQQTRPATGDHWWPLLFGVALAVLLVAVAVLLQISRDFGQGLIASRPGPGRGSLHSVTDLVIRLNRGPVLSWACAFVGIGVVFGYFTGSVTDLFAANPALAEIFASGAVTPADLVAGFLATVLSLVGIIASIAGVQILNRVRTEELDDHAEPVLAGPVSRPHYLSRHVLVALLAPALFVLIAAVVVGFFAAAADLGFWDALGQGALTIPAVWAVVAVAVAVIGARPQVRLASWAGVLASFGLTMLGPSFKLPGWALGISPFYHVPHVVADSRSWWGLLGVCAVAAVLLAVGFAGFRRRDIP